MSAHHALVLTDRGQVHTHRWLAACSCGRWSGRNHRRRAEAVKEHHQHLAACTDAARDARLHVFMPAALTPPDQLPAELRCG